MIQQDEEAGAVGYWAGSCGLRLVVVGEQGAYMSSVAGVRGSVCRDHTDEVQDTNWCSDLHSSQ
jgi:hypothetical protein